jgi:hypothetical protein
MQMIRQAVGGRCKRRLSTAGELTRELQVNQTTGKRARSRDLARSGVFMYPIPVYLLRGLYFYAMYFDLV